MKITGIHGHPEAVYPEFLPYGKNSGTANLTLFNPKTVAGRATYKSGENGLQSAGIPYVIVNGKAVVDNRKVLPVKPGQPIRFPVEKTGRFEPVNTSKWLEGNTISVPVMEMDDTGANDALNKN